MLISDIFTDILNWSQNYNKLLSVDQKVKQSSGRIDYLLPNLLFYKRPTWAISLIFSLSYK